MVEQARRPSWLREQPVHLPFLPGARSGSLHAGSSKAFGIPGLTKQVRTRWESYDLQGRTCQSHLPICSWKQLHPSCFPIIGGKGNASSCTFINKALLPQRMRNYIAQFSIILRHGNVRMRSDRTVVVLWIHNLLGNSSKLEVHCLLPASYDPATRRCNAHSPSYTTQSPCREFITD